MAEGTGQFRAGNGTTGASNNKGGTPCVPHGSRHRENQNPGIAPDYSAEKPVKVTGTVARSPPYWKSSRMMVATLPTELSP